jgi:hypothetical protein
MEEYKANGEMNKKNSTLLEIIVTSRRMKTRDM